MTQSFADERPRVRALAASACLFAVMLTAAPAADAAERLVSIIVTSSSARDAADAVTSHGGTVEESLPIVDGVTARVPASRVPALRQRARVTPDRVMRVQSASFDGDALATAYPAEVGATRLWSRGVAGEGVTVAMIDTGVADVPDLSGRVAGIANLTRERSPRDTYGHGTFQAGLIAGTGAGSGGRYTGVAPAARLLSVKVAGADGSTSLGQVLHAVQLVDQSAARFGVRVLLLALDSQSPLPPEIDPLSIALRKVWSHGVVVVVPAGNDGPDQGMIASPGEDPILLTAASVDDRGTTAVADDVVSAFSARGPTRWGAEKPDVAAPGEHLVSLRAPGSTVDVENASARVGNAYFKGSGTSMSAAVTAGAAALLLQAEPGLSPDEVKATLMGTATPIAGGDGDSVGAGVVDAAEAADADDVDALPDAPDLGEPGPPGGPGWRRGDDGIEHWNARQWNARQWNARQWNDDEWSARQWNIQRWTARQWNARRWAARQWNARQWNARQWNDEQWAARQWAARQWNADDWSARQWNARQWNADGWEARQWNARQWNARQWNARQWNARQWNARQWNDAEWSARQWNARQWNDADWVGHQWSARQWNARQWNAETWG